MRTFRALVVDKQDDKVTASFRELERDSLPEGEVLVRVAYSSLNYKDGLAAGCRPGVVRKYPMVPGIDLAGTVEESGAAAWRPGDQVVMTGCGAGDAHWGGYAQLARLKAEWLVPQPSTMSPLQAMGIGTAGFTAMQSVMALEERAMKPGGREVLVTGAAGGVGSVAVAILAKLGYRVVASTGRASAHDYLRSLGASEILDRAALANALPRPLETERWGGAIDSVGGTTLATLLASMAAGASVAACGVAGGSALPTTVFPFILRGVSLLGMDSLRVAQPQRRAIWARLECDLPLAALDRMIQVAPLSDVPRLAEAILRGEIRGRTVIDVNA